MRGHWIYNNKRYGERNCSQRSATLSMFHRFHPSFIILPNSCEFQTEFPIRIVINLFSVGISNHESILQTIKKHFPEQIHHLFKSYLSNRSFVVKIKDVYCEVKDIKVGVPQGSILGLILYTIYIANIPTAKYWHSRTTQMYVRHTNAETAATTLLQEHTKRIEKWLQGKQIKTNSSKCSHITFTLRKWKPPNIQLNGTHITQTRQLKYLSLHLDMQLTWKQHTKSIIDKIRIKRRQMCWLTSRNYKLSIENKLKIYKTIIKPIWTYGMPLWGTAAT